MDLTDVTELKELTTLLRTEITLTLRQADNWVDIDEQLTTDLNGDQLTEMTTVMGTRMTALIAAYDTLKTAWDGY